MPAPDTTRYARDLRIGKSIAVPESDGGGFAPIRGIDSRDWPQWIWVDVGWREFRFQPSDRVETWPA